MNLFGVGIMRKIMYEDLTLYWSKRAKKISNKSILKLNQIKISGSVGFY